MPSSTRPPAWCRRRSSPQVTAASATLRQGIENTFQDPTLQENGNAIDTWAADNCGYQVVDVHATEYHFAGIPKKLEPGRTIFKLTNDGRRPVRPT